MVEFGLGVGECDVDKMAVYQERSFGRDFLCGQPRTQGPLQRA